MPAGPRRRPLLYSLLSLLPQLGGSGKSRQPPRSSLVPFVPEATKVLRPTQNGPMPRPLQEPSCPQPAAQLLGLSRSLLLCPQPPPSPSIGHLQGFTSDPTLCTHALCSDPDTKLILPYFQSSHPFVLPQRPPPT